MNDLIKTEQLERQAKDANRRIAELENAIYNNRKAINAIKRTAWEAFNIGVGNRKIVEDLSHRITDTNERFDKIQEAVDWIIKLTAGLLITLIITASIGWFFDLF